MKTILFISLTSLLFLSCGSGSQKTSVTGDSPKANNQEAAQWFNPNNLEENDISIEKKKPVKVADKPETLDTEFVSEVETETKANEIISGFRIQLRASKDSKKMRRALNEAKSFFNPRGYEVYLVYESPMYKLRVGDTTDRKRADKLLTLSKENGYRDAWVVPDMVNSALDQGEE